MEFAEDLDDMGPAPPALDLPAPGASAAAEPSVAEQIAALAAEKEKLRAAQELLAQQSAALAAKAAALGMPAPELAPITPTTLPGSNAAPAVVQPVTMPAPAFLPVEDLDDLDDLPPPPMSATDGAAGGGAAASSLPDYGAPADEAAAYQQLLASTAAACAEAGYGGGSFAPEALGAAGAAEPAAKRARRERPPKGQNADGSLTKTALKQLAREEAKQAREEAARQKAEMKAFEAAQREAEREAKAEAKASAAALAATLKEQARAEAAAVKARKQEEAEKEQVAQRVEWMIKQVEKRAALEAEAAEKAARIAARREAKEAATEEELRAKEARRAERQEAKRKAYEAEQGLKHMRKVRLLEGRRLVHASLSTSLAPSAEGGEVRVHLGLKRADAAEAGGPVPVPLGCGIERILGEYDASCNERFCKEHRWCRLLDSIELALQASIGEKFIVRSSMGCGGFARVPWIAVLAPTESTQYGLYAQYLFRADMSAVYLCLGQGTTKLLKAFGAAAAAAQMTRIGDFVKSVARANVAKKRIVDPETLGFSYTAKVELRDRAAGLGGSYEKASILSRRYDTGAIPSEAALAADLNCLLAAYVEITVCL